MYRIIIKRDGTNKLTGRVMYRTTNCFTANAFDFIAPVSTGWRGAVFGILSKKPYRAGCYINPAKVLRESGFIF